MSLIYEKRENVPLVSPGTVRRRFEAFVEPLKPGEVPWGTDLALTTLDPDPVALDDPDTYFAGQRFDYLQEKLWETDRLFVDPEFPPNDDSIMANDNKDPTIIKWIRAKELVNNPRFIVGSPNRFDINQGALGDCWLLAAVGSLTMYKKLFDKVVPKGQSFGDDAYRGIFYFRFWQYGKWVEVVVDDYLPTYNGKLIFMSSKSKNEFWSALLEKAYAKLNCCYEALAGGLTAEAMVDFTGGCAERYDLSDNRKIRSDMYQIMEWASARSSMMAAGILADPFIQEAKLRNGLVRGHAYTVTGVTKVKVDLGSNQGYISLVRLRNPWGNETEWNGAWSDKSYHWTYVSAEEMNRLALSKKYDGEYYMSKKDFFENFDMLEICNITPDVLDDGEPKFDWYEFSFDGAWVEGVSAGGCRNFIDTFFLNPQYKLVLSDPDDEDDLCTVVISLMQKNSRKTGADLYIGYILYHLERPERTHLPLRKEFFESHEATAYCDYFTNKRAVTGRLKLRPGTYIFVPSTFFPDAEGEFYLRIFSEKSTSSVEVV